MKIENPEKFYLSSEQRTEIEKEIEFYKAEEKRMKISCAYLLKITNLENKLWWDDYLKNGCKYSEEDEI
jgi:hypothetical protein